MTPSKRKVSSTFKREIYIYLQERIYKTRRKVGRSFGFEENLPG